MKKFAKLLCLALACVLALSALAACGNGDKPTAKIIDIRLTDEDYAFGVDKTQPELLAQVNDFIAEIMDNGTFEEICNKYFGDGTPTAVQSANWTRTRTSFSSRPTRPSSRSSTRTATPTTAWTWRLPSCWPTSSARSW